MGEHRHWTFCSNGSYSYSSSSSGDSSNRLNMLMWFRIVLSFAATTVIQINTCCEVASFVSCREIFHLFVVATRCGVELIFYFLCSLLFIQFSLWSLGRYTNWTEHAKRIYIYFYLRTFCDVYYNFLFDRIIARIIIHLNGHERTGAK